MGKVEWCVASLLVAAIVFGLIAPMIPVSHVPAFVDENSASWSSYREWSFGLRTGGHLRISALESFALAHGAKPAPRRWRKVYDTGKDIYGRSISFSDGMDSAAMILRDRIVEDWIAHHTTAEVLDLYESLHRDSPAVTLVRARAIQQAYYRRPSP